MGNGLVRTETDASTGEISIFPHVMVKEIALCSSRPSPSLSAALYRLRWSSQGKYVIKDAAYLGYALIVSVSDWVPSVPGAV